MTMWERAKTTLGVELETARAVKDGFEEITAQLATADEAFQVPGSYLPLTGAAHRSRRRRHELQSLHHPSRR